MTYSSTEALDDLRDLLLVQMSCAPNLATSSRKCTQFTCLGYLVDEFGFELVIIILFLSCLAHVHPHLLPNFILSYGQFLTNSG